MRRILKKIIYHKLRLRDEIETNKNYTEG